MSDTEKNGFGVVCDFIDDGYTYEAAIEAEPGVNGPLSITYRPALAEQTSKLIDAGDSDEQYMKRAIDMLATLLKGWSLKDRQGAVVKINRENLARVNRKLLVKIIDRVFFTAPQANAPTEEPLKN